MKKVLLIIIGILFACNVSASSLQEGAIIKTEYSPDVYIIKYKNGKQFKRLVLNPLVFESYGHLKWENIQKVSQSVMNSYATSDLVRIYGQSSVYQLIPNGDIGSKHFLTSVAGHDLDSIYTINSVDFNNYATGSIINSTLFCNGIHYSNCENGYEIICPIVGEAYCQLDKQQQAIRDAEAKRRREEKVAQEAREIAERKRQQEEIDRITKATDAMNNLYKVAIREGDKLEILESQLEAKKIEIENAKNRLASMQAINAMLSILIPEYNTIVGQYNTQLEYFKKVMSMQYVIEDYKNNVYITIGDRSFLGSLGIHL